MQMFILAKVYVKDHRIYFNKLVGGNKQLETNEWIQADRDRQTKILTEIEKREKQLNEIIDTYRAT